MKRDALWEATRAAVVADPKLHRLHDWTRGLVCVYSNIYAQPVFDQPREGDISYASRPFSTLESLLRQTD